MVREMDLVVHTLSSYPDTNSNIKMEVGIEDCLHIEFEYNKQKYGICCNVVDEFLLVPLGDRTARPQTIPILFPKFVYMSNAPSFFSKKLSIRKPFSGLSANLHTGSKKGPIVPSSIRSFIPGTI